MKGGEIKKKMRVHKKRKEKEEGEVVYTRWKDRKEIKNRGARKKEIVTYLSSSVMLSQAVSSSHWLGLSIWASRSSTYMYIHTTAVSVKRACVILMTTVTL